MSKPWGVAGAWAADVERADAEETERRAANPIVESQSFPSLKESLGAKPKKKNNKGTTLSLSEFTTGKYIGAGAVSKRDHSSSESKGLTHDEMIRLPTGPRERSAEEMEVGRLGGGFKNYGGGSSGGGGMGRSSGSDGSWGGGDRRKSNGGFDNDRRERAPPRVSDSDLPSRADEVDNWAVGKKSLPRFDSGRDNRYGGSNDNGRQDKYSSLGGGSRADEVDNWGAGKKPVSTRSSTSSFGSGFRDPLATEADRWTRTGPLPSREGDRERPRLNLDPPRGNGSLNEGGDPERPRLVLNPPSGNGSLNEGVKSTRPSPFGAARPREDVLAEKGVDVKKLDSDIETRKTSRPSSPHSSRPSSAHSNGRPESPAPQVLDLEVVTKPRPKVNPFGDAKPREVLLQEKGKDWRKNDVELEHRSVEGKGWRKNDVEVEHRSVEGKGLAEE
ncbi:hypothetical protein AQUCO_01100476v1 [Aquilegia coerulea]|uniref:Plant specific eukaryotic initiation factor 4B n=1 Tax=Aquilegia coerulea TaxID=218851 RepID=A0A2G5E7U7_AQUCA|nr:hypothetical protein AQUCO_01100476v1 [Aquilegia coerulea]